MYLFVLALMCLVSINVITLNLYKLVELKIFIFESNLLNAIFIYYKHYTLKKFKLNI